MARFSVGGDEDGNEDRPTNRPLPKRPRISNPIVYKRPASSRDNPTTSAAPELLVERISRPEERVPAPAESERQTSDESETSWSDSTSDSEEASSDSGEEEEGIQQQQTQRSGGEVQLTEARTDPVASGSDAGRDPEGSNGSVSVILADPDVLDCPICYEPLCSPVYQCENGHIACASCCTTMKNKCANCCWPIGYNRCRAIEKVLESVRVACRNIKRGCKETFSYSKKLAHEKTCTYAPCSCPYIGCEFVGMSMLVYAHFALKHQFSKHFGFNHAISISLDKNQKHVYLQEKTHSTLFVLNRSVETVGSLVSVVCIAPTSEKRAFLYDLTATVGESSIKLKSFVDIMPKLMAQPPPKIYLLVPSDFISVSGQLKLELTIWRNPAHLN
ncbi:hypothetical protein C2S53_019350 [Perilla frutescens var. hirtella]|uniref:RING-type E3 ubiquitin transferase n=1 Tax=Perilla frutescens var. hirtella TaxID=608512 RepID=A0AAD4ILV6_PERFH|nr:hypothetical protein C2S53_019350 [Perilla frutescens var. hirtella]